MIFFSLAGKDERFEERNRISGISSTVSREKPNFLHGFNLESTKIHDKGMFSVLKPVGFSNVSANHGAKQESTMLFQGYNTTFHGGIQKEKHHSLSSQLVSL